MLIPAIASVVTDKPTHANDPRAAKARLRRLVLERRAGVHADAREAAARALTEASLRFGRVADKVVSGFWPIRGEIDPRPLMERLAGEGATLALPVVIDRETILFRRWHHDDPLVPAGFGTFGPGADAPVVAPDILIVPLAAFDRRLHRIGYGAGHYDRAISRLHALGRQPLLVGVAFSCQEVEAVPAEEHDQPLDGIVTESFVLWRQD